jgi:hypothetical protein
MPPNERPSAAEPVVQHPDERFRSTDHGPYLVPVTKRLVPTSTLIIE